MSSRLLFSPSLRFPPLPPLSPISPSLLSHLPTVLSALGVGCAVIAYDGSPFAPSESTLWALASRLKITILGLSPRYISTLEGRNYLPNKHFDLKHVTQIQTAGASFLPFL